MGRGRRVGLSCTYEDGDQGRLGERELRVYRVYLKHDFEENWTRKGDETPRVLVPTYTIADSGNERVC